MWWCGLEMGSWSSLEVKLQGGGRKRGGGRSEVEVETESRSKMEVKMEGEVHHRGDLFCSILPLLTGWYPCRVHGSTVERRMR